MAKIRYVKDNVTDEIVLPVTCKCGVIDSSNINFEARQ